MLGSVVLGATAALGLASVRGRWTRAIDALFMSPLLLPALAFGFAGLIFFNLVGYGLSLPALVIGHVVVCVPFVVRTTLAALTQLDPALIEASRSLGAGWFYTVRRVTLPIIARGVGAGCGFVSEQERSPPGPAE